MFFLVWPYLLFSSRSSLVAGMGLTPALVSANGCVPPQASALSGKVLLPVAVTAPHPPAYTYTHTHQFKCLSVHAGSGQHLVLDIALTSLPAPLSIPLPCIFINRWIPPRPGLACLTALSFLGHFCIFSFSLVGSISFFALQIIRLLPSLTSSHIQLLLLLAVPDLYATCDLPLRPKSGHGAAYSTFGQS